MSSTTTTATSTGVPQMSAGLPGTAISSMARWPHGATTLMFEGVPTFPDAGRFWAVCEKHKVNQFYTAPTAIRALMGQGDDFVTKYDLSSLTVLWNCRRTDQSGGLELVQRDRRQGERADRRYLVADRNRRAHDHSRCQGRRRPNRIGDDAVSSGCNPLFWMHNPVPRSTATGSRACWRSRTAGPGRCARFTAITIASCRPYFEQYKGYYFTGDGCRRDEDGYYWITGRVDDVINVSGHRMGTAEVESALVAHDQGRRGRRGRISP